MRGIAIAIVLTLFSIECHAQGGPSTGQCDQIRAAIAQYGLHYGLSAADLRTIEQGCGIGGRSRRDRR